MSKSYGVRNAKGDPLDTDTILYGASLTKAVFATAVMQLVDEGVIDLDTTIDHYLPKPLPSYAEPEVEDNYARWGDLAGDDRWKKLTPRILLTHSPGFANFGFLEPDGKLRFHFDPGMRFAYSGDGFILLQFVLERGLGLDLGREMQRRVFDHFGMRNTSMMWRPDFRRNLADGWDMAGKVEPHDERSRVRAAGSMDTTIADFARFAAAFVRGKVLSKKSRAEISRPQLPITTRTQFPTLQPELPKAERRADLAAGPSAISFTRPQGRGFEKGGTTTPPATAGSASRPAAPASSCCPTTSVPKPPSRPTCDSSWAKPARRMIGRRAFPDAEARCSSGGFGGVEMRRKAGAHPTFSSHKSVIKPDPKQQKCSFRPTTSAAHP